MLRSTHLYGFGHERLWRPAGADFDGTNDYLARGADLTGIADSPFGLISFWFRLDGGDGVAQNFVTTSATNAIQRLATNVFRVDIRGTGRVNMSTTGTHTTSATWKHFLASWDTNTAGARHIYISDAADTSVSTFTAGDLDWTNSDFRVGADIGAGGSKINGCLAEFYFTTSWLDISVTANRRKFITAAGTPEYLGKVGEIPLGTVPLVYLSRRFGEAASVFATNRGTGGNFTITGSLDPSSSNP